jgi:hypothetical protein
MSSNSKVYSIDARECPGDALAKINANFIALDTAICNLQTTSKYFDKKTEELNSQLEVFLYDATVIAEKENLYTRVYKTIQSLSSYWRSKQYTLIVPPHFLSPFITNKPEAIRVSVVNKRLPIADYPDYTIVNAIFINYSKNKWTNDTVIFPSLSSIPHLNELSVTIYRYIKTDSGWMFVESIKHEDSPVATPGVIDASNSLLLTAVNTTTDGIYKYITLNAKLSSTGGAITNIPSTDYMSWDWYINDSQITPLPISSTSLSPGGGSYSGNGAVMPVSAISSIRLQILPNTFTDLPEVSSLYIIGNNFSDNVTRSSIITLPIVDVPSKDVLDLKLSVYDTTYAAPGAIGTYIGNSKETSSIVRQTPNARKYRFDPNIYIKPATTSYDIAWKIDEYSDKCIFNTTTPISSTTFLGTNSVEIDLQEDRTAVVTVCAYNIDSIAWADKHTIYNTVQVTNTSDVVTPLKVDFVLFSKYAWVPELKVVDVSNYTTTIPTTAYGGRTDLTAEFYVSASPGFSSYVWNAGTYTLSATSNVSLLKIPYSIDMFSETGLPVSLTAYNTCIPTTNKTLTYIDVNGLQRTHRNTSSTSITSTNIQKQNIRLLPYEQVRYSYLLLSDSEQDISNSNSIRIRQYIKPLNNINVTDFVSGTVTYNVSTSTWSTDITIPAQDGDFTIGCLRDGDITLPLHVDGFSTTDITISATSLFTTTLKDSNSEWETVCNSGIYIDPSTFSGYQPIMTTPSPTPTTYIRATPTPTRKQIPNTDECEYNITGTGKGIFKYPIELEAPNILRVSYNTYNIPDNITVICGGGVLHTTGFVGDIAYLAKLKDAYGSATSIAGPGVGWFDIDTSLCTTVGNAIEVIVDAPLPNSQWDIKLNCITAGFVTPTPTPTPTSSGIFITPTPTKSVTPTATSTLTPTCTPVPAVSVDCDDTVDITGPGSYWFRIIPPTNTQGVIVAYNTYEIPDRIMLYGKLTGGSALTLIEDLGFRGSTSYNSELISLGYTAVTGSGVGSAYAAGSSYSEIYVYVDAPLANTQFTLKFDCNILSTPTPTPTPTITFTPTNTLTPTPTDISIDTSGGEELLDIDV